MNSPSTCKILVMSANPRGLSRLRLDEEIREIEEGLKRSQQSDRYTIKSHLAVRYRDIRRSILDNRPQIVHFCGHGEGESGLAFEDENREIKLVNAFALAGLFRLFDTQVECVVLNACYSMYQAKAIAQHIEYVVGMNKSIGDKAALEFAIGFYDALGAGEGYQRAYEFGCSGIELAGIPEELTPKLWKEKKMMVSEIFQVLPIIPIPVVNKYRYVEKENIFKTYNFDVITVNSRGRKISRVKKQASYFTEELGNGVTLDMVSIPGGNFWMGTEDAEVERLCKQYNRDYFRREQPQHQVTLQPFFMGKFPVTQAQWKAVAGMPKVERDLESDPARFKGNNRPVECVSWYDAVEFCARLSRYTNQEYRLPSEAQWEYACKAGTTTPFHFGETITTDLVNYDGNYCCADAPKGQYREETTPVGNFPPNGFGLYDMHGNVWEWCADDWHENYHGAPDDGRAWKASGEGDLAVIRGGCWGDIPDGCRSAFRSVNYIRRDAFFNHFGFRVVCVAART